MKHGQTTLIRATFVAIAFVVIGFVAIALVAGLAPLGVNEATAQNWSAPTLTGQQPNPVPARQQADPAPTGQQPDPVPARRQADLTPTSQPADPATSVPPEYASARPSPSSTRGSGSPSGYPDLSHVEEIQGDFAAALVMDAESGEVLVASNPFTQRQPASMVKMMTELLVLERVASGDITMSDWITVSAHASRMGGSQVYLKHGEQFTVEELLMALAIHSANDAAVALAEYHAGSDEAFVDLMNIRARELGMRRTVFHSVHGLPPGWQQQPDITCAFDMALLGRELMKHPEAVIWASTATAEFRDGEFTLYNPNRLIGTYRGLDGIKTGYHSAAGYCLTASAVQKDRRLISVVMGCPANEERASETTRLLSYGFNLFVQLPLVEQAGLPLDQPLRIKDGKEREVAVGYGDRLAVFVRRDRTEHVTIEMNLQPDVVAPVEQGQILGRATAKLGTRVLAEVPLVALEAVERGNFWQRLFN